MKNGMIEKLVNLFTNTAVDMAKTLDNTTLNGHCAIETGIVLATTGQPESIRVAVRSELRKRGYRI